MAYEKKQLPDLTDNDSMPGSGKHAGTPMINVPADYLVYIYDNNMAGAQVRKYFEDNEAIIRKEAAKQKGGRNDD